MGANWRREVRSGLDAIAETVMDTPGVWTAWPQLLGLARRTIDAHGAQEALPVLRNHPVAALARECPLTNWSWRQPRGYAGDARLTDYLYNHDSVAESLNNASERGRAISRWNGSNGLAEAVRERRQILANLVDELVEAIDEPEILSIGAQHLREAALCRHARDVSRWVAMERDAESVGEIEQAHGHLPGLVVQAASMERTMVQPREHGRFHFVYTSTALEFFPDEQARRLVRAMFEALHPGGRMLVASLATDLPERGYMNAYMNWFPVLRDENGMDAVLSAVPAGTVARRAVFRGANDRVVYGLIERALYNVKATGHVAKLMRDLGIA